MKNHILKIKYVKKTPLEDSCGVFVPYGDDRQSIIYIQKNTKDYKDTLIHELTHFILYMITGKYFGHSVKFKKLYKFIKELQK